MNKVHTITPSGANISPDTSRDAYYMEQALSLAREAEERGDVPIGAVVVRDSDGEIIGRGMNDREACHRASGHAEMNAIEQACETLSTWHLHGCTLYVTLEPCPMCAGACVNSRIGRVVFALRDAKAGAFGSVMNMNSYPLNHKVAVTYGVCEQEARNLLRSFFEKRRG